MSRQLSDHERVLVERLTRAVQSAQRVLPDFALGCFGHMRIHNRNSAPLDLFLANQTLLKEGVQLIDWRQAPLAAVFFSTAEGDTYELEIDGRLLDGRLLDRNLLTFAEGELLRIDRPETILWRDAGWQAADRCEPAVLRPSASDVRATPFALHLDAEQQQAVELPAGQALLVLGEAGFGKTTVAMHRLARLQRTSARTTRALVLVPTEGLRRLCQLMLARLSTQGVEVATFDTWVATEARKLFARLPADNSEQTAAGIIRLKRHPALRTVLPELAGRPRKTGGRPPKTTVRDDLLHLFGDRDLLHRVVQAAGGDLRAGVIDQVLEHTRLQFSKKSETEWAHVSEDRLRAIDGLPLDYGTPMHDAETIDPEDFPVLFALNYLRTGKDSTRRGSLTTYDHVVLDEAQELAPLELELVGRALRQGGTLTVSGDEHQQVDDTACFIDWPTTMDHLRASEHRRITLRESYRCPQEVTDFARGLFAGGPAPALGGALVTTRLANECHLCALLIDEILRLLDSDPAATVAVICRSPAVARQWADALDRGLFVKLGLNGEFDFKPGVLVTCVAEVKGLEFDYVIIPDATEASYPNKSVANRALYVAATRAVRQLWLLAAGPPLRRHHFSFAPK